MTPIHVFFFFFRCEIQRSILHFPHLFLFSSFSVFSFLSSSNFSRITSRRTLFFSSLILFPFLLTFLSGFSSSPLLSLLLLCSLSSLPHFPPYFHSLTFPLTLLSPCPFSFPLSPLFALFLSLSLSPLPFTPVF